MPSQKDLDREEEVTRLGDQLSKELEADILDRYYHQEYWDEDLIKDFFHDHNIDEETRKAILEHLSITMINT